MFCGWSKTRFQNIKTIKPAVSAGSAVDWQHKDDAVSAAEAVLSREAIRLSDLTAQLQKSVNDRQVALKEKQTQLTEFNGKKDCKHLASADRETRV
jgi:hypothetical protein